MHARSQALALSLVGLLLPALLHAAPAAASAPAAATGPEALRGQRAMAVEVTEPVVRRAVDRPVPLPARVPAGSYRVTGHDGSTGSYVPPPPPGPVRSRWEIDYRGFDAASHPDGPRAREVFQRAVDVWARVVASTVTIRVEATFLDMGERVLGGAGPSAAYLLEGDDTAFYPSALADALTGIDQSSVVPGAPASDITADLNSNSSLDSYYGVDGRPAAGQTDFFSVVLHELGHGLGFAGSARVADDAGSFLRPRHMRYDAFAVDAPTGGRGLVDLPDGQELGHLLQGGGLHWVGSAATAAGGGHRARLEAPRPFVPGSSFSHLDEVVHPAGHAESLMTPLLFDQEAVHSPGPVTVAMLADLGWQAALPAAPSPSGQAHYLALEPRRVLLAAPLGAGQQRTLLLQDVPMGATAVTFNLAAGGVSGNTYVTACPGGTLLDVCRQKASLNTDRRDRSNLVTVKLGGELSSSTRTVTLYNNVGDVLLFADLQGYYVDDAFAVDQARTYRPVAPTRVLAREPLGQGGSSTLVLEDVPLGASAVTLNLAAAGVTATTYVTACPGDVTVDVCRDKASLNAVPGVDSANLVTVKLGGSPTSTRRTVLLYNNAGSVLVFADLQGYHAPGGSSFRARDPQRVLDRQEVGAEESFDLVLQDVPVGATAVAFNLAAAGVTGNTYVSACPTEDSVEVCKQKANLLVRDGTDAAVFVVVKLGGDPTSSTRRVRLYNNVGRVLLFADLQGYYVA